MNRRAETNTGLSPGRRLFTLTSHLFKMLLFFPYTVTASVIEFRGKRVNFYTVFIANAFLIVVFRGRVWGRMAGLNGRAETNTQKYTIR